VLAEAFRVLRPGGRLAVSDVVRRREVSDAVSRSVELWIGCVAGALHEEEYRSKLGASGFDAIDVEPTRIYRAEDAAGFIEQAGIKATPEELDGAFMSAFIRARKPRREFLQSQVPRSRFQVPGPGSTAAPGTSVENPDREPGTGARNLK
jgi:ubiquinone/menaquinone biosynthesis C-methylase UbiE